MSLSPTSPPFVKVTAHRESLYGVALARDASRLFVWLARGEREILRILAWPSLAQLAE
jgi:hypothetical protein